MKIDIGVDGAETVIQKLTSFSDDLMPNAAAGLKAGLETVAKDAKRLCPKDTGELRNSIRAEVSELYSSAVGKVSTNKEYAVYVEMGTGPVGKASGGNGSGKAVSYRTGGWFVPLKRGAVMIKDTEVERASKGFWTYGQPARPYLYPAFKANKAKVVAAIRKAIKGGLG